MGLSASLAVCKGRSLPHVSEIEVGGKKGARRGNRRASGVPGKTLLGDGRTFRPAKATREHMDLQPEGLLNVRTGSA